MRDRTSALREIDFFEFLDALLRRKASDKWDVQSEASLGGPYRSDFLLLPKDRRMDVKPWIIEARLEAPLTRPRLNAFIEQLQNYSKRFKDYYRYDEDPVLALVTLAQLSPQNRLYLNTHGIDVVFDRIGLERDADVYGLREHFDRIIAALEGVIRHPREPHIADVLISKLERLDAGKKDWSLYQSLCSEILSYLFCPPLEQPLMEHSTQSKINRRDIILPNYCPEGFFSFLRDTYHADYIVVDAKNYKGAVGKTQILQMANYLSGRGVGLFGLIVTRNGANRSAMQVQREQWIYHQKLIIALTDEDIRQMIEIKKSGSDPVAVLRQKIEDFRLAI